ncbi:MAG: DUF479 domain-containing protein [Spirochaetales bacterium]|nr:DUF479 domain-containing protein [Spirochaetales bacterium]
MNFLAHALLAHASLADHDGQECTGALMADFCAGCDPEDFPAGIARGMRQHRAIDAYTDSHPEFRACRRAIAEAGAPRFTAGILTDIFWDYMLASNWDAWGDPLAGCGLEDFGALVYDRLGATRAWHSPDFSRAYPWIISTSLLSTYATITGIEKTLAGLSTRMSGGIDLASAVVILVDLEQPIRRYFSEFWPDLIAYAGEWADRCA